MKNSLVQLLFGTKNQQAGRDIITNINTNPFPIRFNDSDIKELIGILSMEVDNICNEIANSDEFSYPGMDRKNELNNLSQKYFEFINSTSLNYFLRIETFLKNNINESQRRQYNQIAFELKSLILCHRNKFEKFEEVFASIYSYITTTQNEKLKFDPQLIWVLLHYMYYNCDIGDKNDKAL